MSAENVMILLDGLAGARMLGFSAYKRLMPHAVGWKLTAHCEGGFWGNIGGGGTFRKPKDAGNPWEVSGRGSIPAGTRIQLFKEKDKSASWKMTFSFEGGALLEVRGGVFHSGEGLGGTAAGLFTLPLPQPYRYTEATVAAFHLDTSTKFVFSYPDCREKS